MNFIKIVKTYFIGGILALFTVFLTINAFGIVVRFFQGNADFDDFQITVILILLFAVDVFFINKAKKNTCPKCKSLFSLQEVDRELISTKNISILTELKNRNSSGEVVGTQEQYIPGIRNTYRVTYKCKKCGEKQYFTKTIDSKNV